MSTSCEALDKARERAEEALARLRQNSETAREAEILQERFEE